jgi:O-antigen/teichoic acid export membrane protein
LERLLRRTATLFVAPSLAAFAIIFFFGGPLLALLGAQNGEYYRQAAGILTVVSFGQLLLALAGSCHCALLMTGHEVKALGVNFCAALALGAIGPLAALRFGGMGLAVTYATVVSLESLVLAFLARRLLGVWTFFDPRCVGPILQSWLRANDADAGGADLELEVNARLEGADAD